MGDNTRIEQLDSILVDLVEAIDLESKQVKEKAKKSSQYKRTGHYTMDDQRYIDKLLAQRNVLVDVINYIRTENEEHFASIDFRNKEDKV